MTVTKIEELSKSRSRVYVDEEPAFVLYRGELRRYCIAEGEELSEEAYRELSEELLPRRAKLRAMNLLKGREYTVRQLRDKLQQGGYPEEVIREALDYVASYRYTDDLRYAVDYISGHEDSKSRRRIEQDLLGRGIDRSTLERAWDEWEEKGGIKNEQGMILRLLEKRHFDPETADRKERQKTCAFLMRKGFTAEQIRAALKSAAPDGVAPDGVAPEDAVPEDGMPEEWQ